MTGLFLVDSHCHLDFPDFAEELDAIVERAGDAGVGAMVTISTLVKRSERLLAITERFPQIFATVGTHPQNAAAEPDVSTRELVARSRHPKVVGIGEAGLDLVYEPGPLDVQERVFRRHIEAARETGLPLVIHSRDSDDDMRRILEDESGKGAFPFVLHCFSAGRALAEAGVALGGMVSFSGILAFKKSDDLREIAAAVPLDRLLVETDAPYLAPPPHRGKRNEPAFVRQTAQVLADTKGVDLDAIATVTTANFFRVFAKAIDPRIGGQPA